MKKIFIILATALLTLASCEKSFDVKYTSQLTGSNAASMVENDPSFLDSYVQGLYGAMCAHGAGGSTNHDDYGIMSVYTNDIDTLRQVVSQSIPQLVNSSVTIVSVLISMIYFYKFLGGIAFSIHPL